jgi:prolyl 4-hydroxylase
MPEINAAVEEWLADHANRGCTAASMVDAMVEVGFDRPRRG